MQPPIPTDPTTPDGLARVEATIEGTGAALPPAPPRRGRKAVVIAVASMVGLAGFAAAASFMALRGSGESLASKIPADTDVVVTAYLDPAASQKVNLFRLTSAFPSLGGEAEVSGRAGDFVDSALNQIGLTHSDLDWVGSQVALTVDVGSGTDPKMAILIDTTDEAAAEASLATARNGQALGSWDWTQEDHGGVQAWVARTPSSSATMGIVDSTVVLATDPGTFDAIVAASGGGAPALADDQNFVDTMAGLPQARLGMVYVAPRDLLSALDRFAGAGAPELGTAAGVDIGAIRGIGVTLAAEPDAMAIDTEVTLDPSLLSPEQLAALGAGDHRNALLSAVPADALAFMGLEHLDTGIETALADLPSDQRDALDQSGIEPAIRSLTGDMAIELSMPGGSSPPVGALMVSTDDADAMRAAFELAGQALSSDSPTVDPTALLGVGPGGDNAPRWETVDHDGVTVSFLPGEGGSTGLRPAYAIFDGTAVIASSEEEAFRIIDAAHGAPNAMDVERVSSAIADVSDSEDVMYVDLAGILGAVADTGAMSPGVRDDLEALQTLVIGSQSDTGHQHARVVLRIG